MLQAYGAYGEKKLYGKTTVGVIRSTFVIDADGKVEKALYGVKATGHVARLMTEVGAQAVPVTASGGRGEMAYAAGLGPVGGDTVGVQIPPPALREPERMNFLLIG